MKFGVLRGYSLSSLHSDLGKQAAWTENSSTDNLTSLAPKNLQTNVN
jgi:hypothetical protein